MEIYTAASPASQGISPTFSQTLQLNVGRALQPFFLSCLRTLPAPAPQYRGIRMDVEVEEFAEGQEKPVSVYDLEPHRRTGTDLPRHNRFYQAKVDARYMLHYLQHSTADNATDDSTKELHDYVSRVKTIPEVRQGYMSLSERFYYERAEGKKEGVKEGAKENAVENILELLEDYGEIPEELKERLNSIDDMALLKKYHKLAAKVGSIAEFQTTIGEWKQ